MGAKEHWEKIYNSSKENEVSWFQPYPETSMELVSFLNLLLHANIIDIGGGYSHFADALLEKGYLNIYVLDISANAIERAKQRLGDKASKVHWIVSDITDFKPSMKFDLWHDRAAFHFLTTEDDVAKYISIAGNAVEKGGCLIIGTFSANGPKKCSGLEIKQYSEDSISAKFEAAFDRIKCKTEDHITPSDKIQNFLFCIFKKK